jgi:hypothetical protein
MGVKTGSTSDGAAADPARVHRAILAGLLSHIGILDTRSVGAAKSTGGDKRKPIATFRGRVGHRSRSSRFGLRKATPTRSWRPNSSRRRACSPARSRRSIRPGPRSSPAISRTAS